MQTLQDTPPETDRFREKREAVLAAAATLFNRNGIRGTTLSDISAELGLTTSSITYYYRKKEELALACFLRAAQAHEELARQAGEAGTVAARVRRLFQLHADFLAAQMRGERPPLIGFNDLRALPEAQEAAAFAAYNDLFRSVRRLLKTAPQHAVADLNSRAHLLLSQVNFMAVWLGRHEVSRYRAAAAIAAELVLHGLAGPGVAFAPGDGQPARKLGPADERNETFLRVATELVNEKGYRGASVEAIAARMNLTKGSFYYDNETKLDLVTACFERTFSLLRGALAEAEAGTGPVWQRMTTAAARLIRFQLSDRGPLLRTSAEIALPDEEHRQLVRRTNRQLTERIAMLLSEGMTDGSIRPCHTPIAAQLISCAINSAAELRRWAGDATVETVTGLYTRPLLLGLEGEEVRGG